ncbi:MAG: acyl-CoA synthetase FdrA [Acidobacteria bacterium]|nr:MAG: acyl-CoA synthetase FdrA [Acidobacteriota bacterium]
MSVVKSELRRGHYCDSIVLMQLQAALAGLPGIADSGAVMATEANRQLLASQGLLPEDAGEAGDGDLLVVVKAEDENAAERALGQIDALLARRRGGGGEGYRPKSLAAAVRQLPAARWASISVPGRYAAELARQALELGRNVFLYSDNVSLDDEVELKRLAAERGLLVMGPDCGTAIVGGIGLGFANRVRRGAVGLIGASGTGLQAIASRLHQLGAGVSHALGTGGRDLSAEVGGATARQALALLAGDPATRVVTLVSKPPAPAVAARLLAAARSCGKPVVIDFLGYVPPVRRIGSLHFAAGLEEAAELAAELADGGPQRVAASGGEGYLRGLFAGGTLATETLLQLRLFLTPLASNAALAGVERLADPTASRGHTVLDLGADELTVGRLHPMIDPDLRLRRLRREAADPEVGLLLLDVVLGEGADPDPAASLAPAVAEIKRARPELAVVLIVVGTGDDPQDRDAQIERLSDAGAEVYDTVAGALARASEWALRPASLPAVEAGALASPPAVINAGLESFYSSLVDQGAEALQLDWRPPAGGDEKLIALLRRMR